MKADRNYGIDLLRIVSMFMIVANHLVSQGIVFSNIPAASMSYFVLKFFQVINYSAVNIFILISGYVGYTSRFRYTNIVSLWLTVEWYSVGFVLLEKIINPNNVKWKSLFRAFLPVSFDKYWFFTAYFCVFFFFPLIAKAVEYLSKKQSTVIIASALFLFCIVPLVSNEDIFHANNGYSAVWFAVLYFIGAFVKKYEDAFHIKRWLLCLLYFVSCAITFIPNILLEKNTLHFSVFKIDSLLFMKYSSLTMTACALCAVLLFKGFHIKPVFEKVISFFAPLCFSVYLIHHNEFGYKYIIENRFSFLADFPLLPLLGAVALSVTIIFLCCACIDYLRFVCFKLLHIKERLQKAEDRLLGRIWDKKTQVGDPLS